MPRRNHEHGSASSPPTLAFELEVIPGLEQIAAHELRQLARGRVTLGERRKEGLVPVRYAGSRDRLLELQTVLAVYEQRHFEVPRPKALLGQSSFDTLLGMIDAVRSLHPPGAFESFRISAAGEESSVMLRLREQIASETGLSFEAEEGDLLLRVRRPLDGRPGWEVLIRLSPRPLSVRSWRVCNLPGALNASVAHAMALLTRPHADDVVLNMACGSGTLLIERLAAGPARIALGCDIDRAALACARENVAASEYKLRLERWDAGRLPTPDGWVDVVLADLPFGQLVGSHASNTLLYPRILAEAARVTVGGGLFAAITQDIRLWERLVADAAAAWTVDTVLPIKLPFAGGYLHPRIYLLRRK